MEILVEIGTPENKEKIREELMSFLSIFSRADDALDISKVIVPVDFDAKVNELQGTSDYQSNKGTVAALATNVKLVDGDAIILSPLLYTSAYCDGQVRLYISLHEITHTFNRNLFPKISTDSASQRIYLENLYTLFDEYVADRFALEIFDDAISTKTVQWNRFIREFAEAFCALINDRKYLTKIRTETGSFRQHADGALFLKNIQQDFRSVAIGINRAFAIIDHDPQILPLSDLMQSQFVNEKTLALMNFFRAKYQEQVYDMQGAFELMVDFMTNFGMKFEDVPEGLYCHVLDI